MLAKQQKCVSNVGLYVFKQLTYLSLPDRRSVLTQLPLVLSVDPSQATFVSCVHVFIYQFIIFESSYNSLWLLNAVTISAVFIKICLRRHSTETLSFFPFKERAEKNEHRIFSPCTTRFLFHFKNAHIAIYYQNKYTKCATDSSSENITTIME